MPKPKIHFMFEAGKEPAAGFAQALIDKLASHP